MLIKILRFLAVGAAFVLAFAYHLATSPAPYLGAIMGWWAVPAMSVFGCVQTLLVLLAWDALERFSPQLREWTSRQREKLAGEDWRRVRERGCLAMAVAVGLATGPIPATLAVLLMGASRRYAMLILAVSHVIAYGILVAIAMAGVHVVF